MPTTVSEIEVIGTRITRRGGVLQWQMATAISNYQQLQPHQQRDPDNIPDPCSFPQAARERNVDAEAAQVAQTIFSQNWTVQEYGAVLAKDGTQGARHGPITGSRTDQWVSTPENFEGIAWLDIIGVIHNHPASENPTQSGNVPSPGDWAGFAHMETEIANRGGDITKLRMYIIGPDGVIREYDASIRNTTQDGNQISEVAAGCP